MLLPAITIGQAAIAAGESLSGSWVGWICPQPGPANAARCSSFSLHLLQKGRRLCGSHLYATAGARQLDEGGMPSLLAILEDGKATGTVESVRKSPSVRIAVTLLLADGELQWQRLANPAGDYLLPDTLRMTRSRQGGLSQRSEQHLSAACSAHLDMPTDKDKTAAAPKAP
ncbi:MAG: hypothetical protein Q7U14_04975 [Lacisediminimonas sp.]|nr:hypothetical protein [Lacisediminimonas sp.]